MSGYKPTEADREDAKSFLIGLSLDGTDETPQSLPAEGVDDIVAELAALFAKVRADGRAKHREEMDRADQVGGDLVRQLHEHERARHDAEQALALAEERAKRPDLEQLRQGLRAEATRRHRPGSDAWHRFQEGAEHALYSLALEPEAREEPVSVARVLHALASLAEEVINIGDVAEIVAMPPGTTGLAAAVDARDSLYEEPATWIRAQVDRLHQLLPASEAREEAELFHDQDGDLWKLTDKGEWFHEEEPGEFRQVLSIDAEDQTLTPVGHAELAPAPKAREVTDAAVVRAVARAMVAYGYSENDLRFDPGVRMRATLEAAREAE